MHGRASATPQGVAPNITAGPSSLFPTPDQGLPQTRLLRCRRENLDEVPGEK